MKIHNTLPLVVSIPIQNNVNCVIQNTSASKPPLPLSSN